MRYYFNLVNDTERIVDGDGVEAKDLDQAWAQALKAIEELREEDGAEVGDWSDWHLEVTDAFGTIVFSIKLNSSLH
jgi:hypothetical protein